MRSWTIRDAGKILGDGRELGWTQINRDEKDHEEWTLQLKETDLPLTDKTFFVGCQTVAPASNKSCKVTVNVNARPSSADDKNVVSCAYGQASNEKVVEVEMSEEKNTLTVDCGKDGSMQPTDYITQYCAPDTARLDDCANNYLDILDKFHSNWWTSIEKNSVLR